MNEIAEKEYEYKLTYDDLESMLVRVKIPYEHHHNNGKLMSLKVRDTDITVQKIQDLYEVFPEHKVRLLIKHMWKLVGTDFWYWPGSPARRKHGDISEMFSCRGIAYVDMTKTDIKNYLFVDNYSTLIPYEKINEIREFINKNAHYIEYNSDIINIYYMIIHNRKKLMQCLYTFNNENT